MVAKLFLRRSGEAVGCPYISSLFIRCIEPICVPARSSYGGGTSSPCKQNKGDRSCRRCFVTYGFAVCNLHENSHSIAAAKYLVSLPHTAARTKLRIIGILSLLKASRKGQRVGAADDARMWWVQQGTQWCGHVKTDTKCPRNISVSSKLLKLLLVFPNMHTLKLK